MQRPMISIRTIKFRVRRTSPTRPALLVGPSRLLRGDKVRDPNVNRPRDQSPECGLLVAVAVFITQSATSNPFQAPPARSAPGSSRVSVTRVMRTAAPSNQTTHPAFTSQTSHAVLSAADRRSLYVLATCAKEESQGPEPLEGSSVKYVGGAEDPVGTLKWPPRRNSQLAEVSL